MDLVGKLTIPRAYYIPITYFCLHDTYYIVPSYRRLLIFSCHSDIIITPLKGKGIITMKNEQSNFTLRIDSELLQKFHYVAEYNAALPAQTMFCNICLIPYIR